MWFYAELQRNPDLLEDIISQQDILKIARSIDKESDTDILSRISYELALDGRQNKDHPNRLPILTQAFDVLNEHYSGNKEGTPEKSRFEDLFRNLDKVRNSIEDESIYNPLLFSEIISKDDLADVKSDLSKLKNALTHFLHDGNRYMKKRFKGWGTLGRYKSFIGDCAQLYSELTDKKFTADFYRDPNKNICEPMTEGTRFTYEFHNLLNKIAVCTNCEEYTNHNLASACEEIRKSLNAENKNKNK